MSRRSDNRIEALILYAIALVVGGFCFILALSLDNVWMVLFGCAVIIPLMTVADRKWRGE